MKMLLLIFGPRGVILLSFFFQLSFFPSSFYKSNALLTIERANPIELKGVISSKNLILDLLQMSKDQEEIAIDKIVQHRRIPLQRLNRLIQGLNHELDGIIEIGEDSIYIPKKEKMKLVNKAISSGISLEQVIETLHWKEFESFCLMVLDHHEFSAIHNYYFSFRKKRYEIDVIGMKKPLIFAIDAKKWKTGQASALKVVVKNQINRVRAFSKSLFKSKTRQKLNLSNWKQAKIIPIIVTSKMYEIKIFERIPIIPFFKLNGFITDYHRYSQMIFRFSVKLTSQKSLTSN